MRRTSEEEETEVAQRLGFEAFSFSEQEQASLPPSVNEAAYCLIRNHILAKWRADVTQVLTETAALSEILDKHRALAKLAYRFLHRHGFVNFGLVARPQTEGRRKATVVVIGAGLSGLAAARQLQAFGHRTVVVEARSRAGGRVHTVQLPGKDSTSAGCLGELGGSVITGADGNPLAVLARQLGAKMHVIRDRCPIYAVDGTPVPEDMDHKIEHQFNALLDACATFRSDIGQAADVVSLGRALEQLSSDHGVGTNSPSERALLDWHLANLEYANAGLLASLSLGQWDQDDPWEMPGDHCLLPGGNTRLVAALCADVPIFYSCRVDSVEHGSAGVTLCCTQEVEASAPPQTDGPPRARRRVFRADAVLVTLPLGVLKKGAVHFEPPLPARKLAAISSLGFGTLNKCVMRFETPFWDTTLDTFGRVAATRNARGEFFLFYSYAHLCGDAGAVLIGLVAGEAAGAFEQIAAEASKRSCLAVLRSIFGCRGVEVPEPLTFACTAWAGDPFACGSYSHVAVGSSGDDYTELAAPVGDRLFFAGEATTRNHPATMHGAYFSGLREAARIASCFAGRKGGTATVAGVGGASAPKPAVAASDRLLVLHQLESAFAAAVDWEFGVFSVKLDTSDCSPNAPALVRVEVGRGGGVAGKRVLPVYLHLRRADALALRDCPGGDTERLRLLATLRGGALCGRRHLPSAAVCELAARSAASASDLVRTL